MTSVTRTNGVEGTRMDQKRVCSPALLSVVVKVDIARACERHGSSGAAMKSDVERQPCSEPSRSSRLSFTPHKRRERQPRSNGAEVMTCLSGGQQASVGGISLVTLIPLVV